MFIVNGSSNRFVRIFARLGRRYWRRITRPLRRLSSRSRNTGISKLGEELHSTTWSARRLNFLADQLASATTYLEIGTYRGHTLAQVKIPFKWGVDPEARFDQGSLPAGVRFSKSTSDDFFAVLSRTVRFDLVFLDGLHEARQVYRDLRNVLLHCHDSSLILVDDVIPDSDLTAHPDEATARQLKTQAGIRSGRWHGDVWKLVPLLHEQHPELGWVLFHDQSKVAALGEDNPQMIVWRKGKTKSLALSAGTGEEFLGTLEGVGFESYRKKYPALFEMRPETEALTRAVKAVAAA